jgi:hypothetical protein
MIKKYNLVPFACGLLAIVAWGCAAPVAPEEPDQGESGDHQWQQIQSLCQEDLIDEFLLNERQIHH